MVIRTFACPRELEDQSAVAIAEATMTLQAFSPSIFAPAREDRERSFWRQLLGTIMEGRQRKADEYVRDYLRRHRGDHPDEFRSELERRLLGQ
jgi:hypothetical protein